MKKNILVIGVRSACYQALNALGHHVILWGDKKIHSHRKNQVSAWIEYPYSQCMNGLTEAIQMQLKKFPIDHVITSTEETVILGARVREFLGIHGVTVSVAERFRNKWIMKNTAQEIGIPMTKYQLIDADTQVDDLIEYLGLPILIKPISSSGARNISIVSTKAEYSRFKENTFTSCATSEQEIRSQFSAGISDKRSYLAESLITGTEMSVETFTKDGIPFFHNSTEYLHIWRKSMVPADLGPSLKNTILELNDKLITHFGLDSGMTHAEFYLTDNGPLFGEIALRPPGGYLMNLIEKVYGFDPWITYVQLECGEKMHAIVNTPNGFACVYLMHPGEGKVEKITGIEQIEKKLTSIFDFNLRIKVGDYVTKRLSTSNEVGHILLWASTRKQLLIDLAYIESNFAIQIKP